MLQQLIGVVYGQFAPPTTALNIKYIKIVLFFAISSAAYGNCGKCDANLPPHNHNEIAGTIIGVNEEAQTIQLMTPFGPKTVKVNEKTDLLIRGEFEGALLDMDIEEFKREVPGKQVRIASRN